MRGASGGAPVCAVVDASNVNARAKAGVPLKCRQRALEVVGHQDGGAVREHGAADGVADDDVMDGEPPDGVVVPDARAALEEGPAHAVRREE